MSTFVPSLNHNRQQRPPPPPEMVGKLQLKSSSHWNSKIDLQFCTDNGITIRPEQTVSWWSRSYLRSWKDKRIGNVHNVRTAVVDLQRSLVYSAKCRKNKMVLTGELFKQWWNKDMKVREYYRTPFHDDLLENWEAFVEDLNSYEDGIEGFTIKNIMLPPSPFFSSSIMPIITANITTITSLELVNCDLKAGVDVDMISKFVKKNKSLEILNLSRNELFGIDDKRNKSSGAKKLSKAMKDHPELAYVNLASTGIGGNNEGLKLLLDGGKSINILIIDENVFDEEGLEMVTNFLQKKNETTELGMDSIGIGIGEGDSSKAKSKNSTAKSKLMKECLERNTTLEQLSLSSNNLGNAKGRVLSTVMSGMKSSVSLVYVDLSGNDIRRMPSIKLVAKYLASNPSLVGLDLSNNFMPAKSASVLMQSLKTNTTLQQLYLRNNRISDKSVPGFTDALQNNNTLRHLDLQYNNLRVQTGRKVMIKALCDMSSLDSIVNSNHTCSIVIAGRNYGGTFEEELGKINALENEGEKIRYKVVLAKKQNKELINNRMFDDVPLELIPRVLELVQQEIGCHGYGEGIVKSVKKRNTINRLSNLYELISQWPDFHLLFARGPGKASLTKTGKLKKKQDIVKRKRVADEDEDFVPNGFRKANKRPRWQWNAEKRRYVRKEPTPVKPSRSSSRVTNIASISYADAENSEDES